MRLELFRHAPTPSSAKRVRDEERPSFPHLLLGVGPPWENEPTPQKWHLRCGNLVPTLLTSGVYVPLWSALSGAGVFFVPPKATESKGPVGVTPTHFPHIGPYIIPLTS